MVLEITSAHDLGERAVRTDCRQHEVTVEGETGD
jgi:hypothetical protein